MIELNSNQLTVSFPELALQPKLGIDLQRTLRIPDDGKNYPLPPGLGRFPLRHIDDYARNIPDKWLQRGGIIMPMWQSEALWIHFDAPYIPERQTSYPFAIKIATGKINAVTGKSWERGLDRNPQNYLAIPGQPWLDGYCVEKGIIRQFVAMPLGEGYSVEEQITGQAELGGMQIEIFPMRAKIFEKRFPIQKFPSTAGFYEIECGAVALCAGEMGLAPGGRMRQEIYKDRFSIHDWDTEHSSRCFIHLVNSLAWHKITGQKPPSPPPTASQYTRAGYPWFDYYDDELKALEGAMSLSCLKTVKEISDQNRAALPDNQTVSVTNLINLRASLAGNQVRESDF